MYLEKENSFNEGSYILFMYIRKNTLNNIIFIIVSGGKVMWSKRKIVMKYIPKIYVLGEIETSL